MRLLVSMGLPPDDGGPRRAMIRALDPDTGVVTDAATLDPTPGLHPDADAECTGAHLDGDVLVQATRTEVARLSLSDLREVGRFSHPLLHDVHDALPLPGGGLAVSATGHDSVLVFDASGALVRRACLGPGDWDARFGDVTDFRPLPFDRWRPHHAHPNHLALVDGRLWVTCLNTRESRCLDADLPPVRFDGPPHDGRVIDGARWFTTVDGFVIEVDPADGRVVRRLDLRAMTSSKRMLGWCRGVEKVGDRLFVGMTTLRSSRHRELLRAALRGERGRKLPTRVVEVDLAAERIVAEHDVGTSRGGTIYTITATP